MVTLGDVAEVSAGNPAPQEPGDFAPDGPPFVRMQDVGREHHSKSLAVTTDKLAPDSARRYRLRLYPIGTLLVPKSGASVNLNHRALLGVDAYVVSHLATVMPDTSIIDPEFLYYWSLTYDPRHQAQTTSLPSLPTSLIKAAALPLPEMDEQRRIVDLLSRAEGIVRLRREAQKKAAEIIPALFIDMFGDPATNPKGWLIVKVGDIVHTAQDGPHVSPTYADSGVPFLSTRHIKPGQILFEDLKFLRQEEAAKQWKKCKPRRGDVLYTKGGTTGLAAAIDFDTEIAVWVHVAVLKTDHSKVLPLWLESMLNSDFCYRQSQELTHGIANRDLGLKRMVKISAYLPPKAEQQGFVDMAIRIRAIKEQQVAATANAEATFNALLARSFSDSEQVRSAAQRAVAVA